MNVNVKMMDDYKFILDMDDEAIELIHQICEARVVSAESVVNEIMLGGITMQVHLFVCPIKPNDKLMRYRWFHLLNIFKVFRK